MRYKIGRSFSFSAAHHLEGLPDGHKCARVHGHTYRVEVVVASDTLASPGFVTDFADLNPFGAYLAANFDHRDLNQVLAVQPTSEALAEHLAGWFQTSLRPKLSCRLVSVRVWESDRSWAEFTPELLEPHGGGAGS
jgi:6-pyruvoyltetrahydropterin/6-carboxytetrahydropterin synthase